MLLPHSFSCGKTKITADKAFVSVEWEVNVRLKCSAARNMGFGGWGSDYCGIPSTLTAAPSPTGISVDSLLRRGVGGRTVCVAPFICTYGGAWWLVASALEMHMNAD
jgi:hypothetical protein